MDQPFSLVIFGASGHLAKLKLYPELYTLALKDKLPADYAIVGYARSDLTETTFRALVEESVKSDMIEVNAEVLRAFLEHVHYVRGGYDREDDLRSLAKRLTQIESDIERVRLLYLAVPPTSFQSIVELCCKTGVRSKNGLRCIVEKPVGHNLQSFESIQSALQKCFCDDEIYLLDHYLGKEAVRNVYYLRFANPIFEHLLTHTLLHHIEVVATESKGLEGRSGYFSSTGTLRDMVQSHLLQVIALLTMRLKDRQEDLPQSRFAALEQLYLPHVAHPTDLLIQGQYGEGKIGAEHVPGFLEEPEIDPSSRTNTFIALKLLTREAAFSGVPLYLLTGKRLKRKETRISLHFRSTVSPPGATPNRLDIILQGEAGMRILLQTKVGGSAPLFRPLILTDPLVCTGDCLPEHALLLLEAMQGNRTWFLSFDEVRTAWRLIDPLQSAIDQPTFPLALYPSGIEHPLEADRWIKRDGIDWCSCRDLLDAA